MDCVDEIEWKTTGALTTETSTILSGAVNHRNVSMAWVDTRAQNVCHYILRKRSIREEIGYRTYLVVDKWAWLNNRVANSVKSLANRRRVEIWFQTSE